MAGKGRLKLTRVMITGRVLVQDSDLRVVADTHQSSLSTSLAKASTILLPVVIRERDSEYGRLRRATRWKF